MLEERVGDHGHECVAMKSLPGSSLEVIKPEFFFQLLMGLFANPSRLDGGGQRTQVCRCGQVGQIVFLFPRRPMFADEPGFVAWKMLPTFVLDAEAKRRLMAVQNPIYI